MEKIRLNCRYAATITFIAISISIFINHEESYGNIVDKEPVVTSSPNLTSMEALSKEIKLLVKRLEYSDKTAEDFIDMAMKWKDDRQASVLAIWYEKLTKTRESYAQSRISTNQFAEIEESVARELRQRIIKEISYSENFSDLIDTIKYKQANCLSYSQLIYVLGNSIGLPVKVINIVNLVAGTLPNGAGHMACIINLNNGKQLMVDASLDIVGASKPFNLEKEFIKVGNYLELIDKSNPLKIHRKIQMLDENGLIAGIYNNRVRNIYDKDLGQYDKDISGCTRAIALNPEFAEAYCNRGCVYVKLGQIDKAVSDYTKAIALNPEFAEAYSNRGSIYDKKLGQFDKAIYDYTKAIELDPGLAEAYCNRGNVYTKSGQHDKAIFDCTKAIELNPSLAEAYCYRGNANFRLDKHNKALPDYTKAIELKPGFAEAYCNRGNAYVKLGQTDQAVSDYNKAIELDSKCSEAYCNRGNVYFKLGQCDKALSDCTKAIELNPKYATAYCNRGIIYSVMRQPNKAVFDYAKAIELNPDFAEAYCNRGNINSFLRQYGKAIADYTKAIELDPGFAEAYNNRAVAYYFIGQYDESWEDVQMAKSLGLEARPGFLNALRANRDSLALIRSVAKQGHVPQ